MKLLIFRTDIKTQDKLNGITHIINNTPMIKHWSVDMEDYDKVMRIEAMDDFDEKEFIYSIKNKGFHCEELPD